MPRDDLAEAWLIDDDRTEHLGAGPARRHSLRVRDAVREGAAWVWQDGAPEAVRGTVRFRWNALDAWLEEDEPVYVHPRSPYARVDALRSSSRVRVEIDGVVLADAPHCVKLFETGLPTRYYLDRAHINWPLLRRTDHVTQCPYKGTTSGYWSFDAGTGRTRTSSGRTTSRPPRSPASRAWRRSTASTSTCTWTAPSSPPDGHTGVPARAEGRRS